MKKILRKKKLNPVKVSRLGYEKSWNHPDYVSLHNLSADMGLCLGELTHMEQGRKWDNTFVNAIVYQLYYKMLHEAKAQGIPQAQNEHCGFAFKNAIIFRNGKLKITGDGESFIKELERIDDDDLYPSIEPLTDILQVNPRRKIYG